MLRSKLTWFAALTAIGLSARDVVAAELSDTGRLTLGSAAFQNGLDGPASLGSLRHRVFRANHEGSRLQLEGGGATLAAKSFVGENESIEGAGALRIQADQAVLLGDAASFAALAGKRVEVRAFARALGAMPELRALYSKQELGPDRAAFPTAQVIALRTGRATDDGWIEVSTGPIDASVLGTPLVGILVVAAPLSGGTPSAGKGSFLVDALEIVEVPGPLLSGGNCTLPTEATACKPGAVCAEGYCVDSAVVHGALPTVSVRREIVARTSMMLTRFQGDRNGNAKARAGFAAEMPRIADQATHSAAFHRELARLAGEARGAHTSISSPNPMSRLSAGIVIGLRAGRNELEACFGVVERDLSGGGRGFGVYQRAGASPLRVGDVLDVVDGEPVAKWISRLAASHNVLAADPDADAPRVARVLDALVASYARTLTVSRCAAGGACTKHDVDVAALRASSAGSAELECSPRFRLAVDVPAGVDPDAYEAAIRSTKDGITSLHLNGEPGDSAAWMETARAAFETAGDRLLIDKRRGDGGGGATADLLISAMRRPRNYGLFTVGRIDYAAVDGEAGFLDALFKCKSTDFTGICAHGREELIAEPSVRLPAKVAWLTVLAGSASDATAFFAKGAQGVRIFGPNRTLGLFGGLLPTPPILPGWTAGSIQLEDGRTGLTLEERRSGSWHSGRGVEPDEIVVQKESDLLAGRDTLIDRARAWLAE